MTATGASSTLIRGALRAQLRWWQHTLHLQRIFSAKFFVSQPQTPLVCSDASGDDGWGSCAMGLHIVGMWPDSWRQVDGDNPRSMLYKELVPPVMTTLLLAPELRHKVLCSEIVRGKAMSVQVEKN